MNGPRDDTSVRRRTILRAALITGSAVPGCAPDTTARGRVLLAYFSRPGENYHYGGRTTLTVGNTEVLAGKIRDLIGCEVHRIEPADPYPDGYDATVKRNVVEQDTDARPAIKGTVPDLGPYDTVLLGSPIWNVRAPMIMTTFTEQLDFSGKVVVPFTTHAMSGLGNTASDYAKSCRGAKFADGLAVEGEEVGQADDAVRTWLRQLGLLAA